MVPQALSLPFLGQMLPNKHINEIVDFADAFLKSSASYRNADPVHGHAGNHQKPDGAASLSDLWRHKIVEHVQNSNQNGYIWHTTGSGKTLTSFKASQIIMKMPDVEKVLFVVDRNDLDTQTSREFNAFKAGEWTVPTVRITLVKQLDQRHDKLIVTTVRSSTEPSELDLMPESIDYLKNKKVVFIFDECHRSQFGDTHQNIRTFWPSCTDVWLYGYTDP